jgi:signal transduction histidine kinase
VEHLAVPVALVAQAVAASQALARSEQRVIEERARERRRVLDDLHDGLGPALAGVGLQLSAARRRLAETADQDARASDGLVLLDAAGDAVRDARTALRQLARELAPGAASVAGHRSLAGSVAELVDGWSVAGHEIGLDVRLEACEVPEAASEAVELAAYRILGEAVTNVVRHARASRCTVRVSPRACPDGALELLVRVADDGRGCAFDTWNGPGVGLRSMRARAEELGGRLTMDDAPDGGTVLTAHLPLRGRT